SAFTVNSATGQLRANGYSLVGKQPYALTVDPRGKFAYVANSGDNTASAFSIEPASGALSSVPGSPFPVGTAPLSIVVDPSGAFAYSTNAGSNDVSAFAIDTSSGALTPLKGSPFSAGTDPTSIT